MQCKNHIIAVANIESVNILYNSVLSNIKILKKADTQTDVHRKHVINE